MALRLQLFLISLLFIAPVFVFSQNISFNEIDKRMLAIPDLMEESSSLIAAYINNEFDNEDDKIRAIFIWIAKNIGYDLKGLNKIQKYKGKQKTIEETLNKREALCQGYATLFNDLAEKSGIKSFIISGYTKQNGKVLEVGHAWNIAKIGNQWFIFDPTWGAGHILNSNDYVKSTDNYYFKPKPEEIIKTHMPIDPLWQLLNYPISNQAFYDGKIAMDSSQVFFNYLDSIAHYDQQSKLEQYRSSYRRIKEREIKNGVIEKQLEYLSVEIDYHHNHTNIQQFNIAIDHYNEAVTLFNEFAIYRNKASRAKKSTAEIRNMLKQIKSILYLSKKQLIIHQPRKELLLSIREAQKQINELELKCKEQEIILDTYL